jgi:hypothetical protein
MPLPWPRPHPDRVLKPGSAPRNRTIQRMRRSRMFGWERNPLRRRIDRVEGGLVVALIVVFLIAAPVLTVMAGHSVYGAGVRQQHAAAWRQIPAPVPRGSAAQETYSGSLTRPPLRRAPLGAQVALGEVLVASGLTALFVLLSSAGRCLVSRRRCNDWDRAWLDVAPQWTKRR